MAQKLIIVYLADDRMDVEAVKNELDKERLSYDLIIVGSKARFLEIFVNENVDLIIANYNHPAFNGDAALAKRQENYPYIPFLMLSDTLGEDLAVETLKKGATDYIVKHQLQRLGPAVRRALKEKTLQQQNRDTNRNMQITMERYQDLYDNAPDMYFSVAKNGQIITINQRGAEYLGYTQQDLIGEYYWNLFTSHDTYRIQEQVKKTFTNQHNKKDTLECRLQRKDGTVIWVNESIRFIPSTDSPPEIRIICRDITEQIQSKKEKKLLEQQLLQVQKMKAVTALAGGVAHQFNNSLVGITGNIELLKMDFEGNETVEKYAKRIFNSAMRMAQLTNSLLAYSEGGKYQPQTLQITPLLYNTLSMMQHKLSENIALDIEISEDTYQIEGDMTQVQMVLSAVITNAIEAITDCGNIRIRSQNIIVDDQFAKNHPGLKIGPAVCLTIIDDGKGMDEETLQRIFEPFFTTNFMGRGLGMAAVYGIVKNHYGWIDIQSEPGKGTTVNIFLPSGEHHIQAIASENSLEKGTGTILLIEDEKMVIDVTRAMIKKLGYHVIEACSGKEALDIVQHHETIDLVLLDLGLPDIGGKELYHKLVEKRKDLKIIVCSGFSIDGPAREMLDSGIQDFLQKPFAINELSEKLRKFIERRKDPRLKIRHPSIAAMATSHVGGESFGILDISRNGFALKSPEKGIWPNAGTADLAFCINDQRFSMDNIRYHVVSDCELQQISQTSPQNERRLGIAFEALTMDQRHQLDHFIQKLV